ncbi:hypothetical protein [Pseudidiomarina sp.]|uniref:hypothetical protein n=1 Tax=Pseudidiomarina sp. TaxID=2081707 RepID=UPI003A97A3D5
MTPYEINRCIRELGLDQSVIAAAFGCSTSLVSKTINRTATSTPVARKLAKLIRVPFLQVFPDYEHLLKHRSHSKAEKILKIKTLLEGEDDQ